MDQMTDKFADLADIMLDEKDLLTTTQTVSVTARKPKRDEWFRVSTEARHKPFVAYIYEVDKRMYLLTKTVAGCDFMQDVSKKRMIFVAMNDRREVFLSPVGLDDSNWSITARRGHQQARDTWTRLVSDKDASCYKIHEPTAPHTVAPVFPDKTFNELLRDAFGSDGLLDDLEHPVVKNLKPKA